MRARGWPAASTLLVILARAYATQTIVPDTGLGLVKALPYVAGALEVVFLGTILVRAAGSEAGARHFTVHRDIGYGIFAAVMLGVAIVELVAGHFVIAHLWGRPRPGCTLRSARTACCGWWGTGRR